MATPITSLRIPAGDKATIQAAAGKAGLSLSEFMIKAAVSAASPSRTAPAEAAQRSGAPVRSAAEQDPSARLPRVPAATAATASSRRCPPECRTPVGSYCKVHGAVRAK